MLNGAAPNAKASNVFKRNPPLLNASSTPICVPAYFERFVSFFFRIFESRLVAYPSRV
uniref:Uncharacterized protein n=1 Tax=Daphnia magna TaxID=35525 RepID=A0A0P6G400_9CRUS